MTYCAGIVRTLVCIFTALAEEDFNRELLLLLNGPDNNSDHDIVLSRSQLEALSDAERGAILEELGASLSARILVAEDFRIDTN